MDDDKASLRVPYWHKGEKAVEIFREIWSYLEIMSREGNYLIYDPQMERVSDRPAGFDEALACYTRVVSWSQQKFNRNKKKPPGNHKAKAWWKFW